MRLNRRSLLRWGAVGLGGAAAGCDQVGQSTPGMDALSFGNWLTYKIQRLVVPPDKLAAVFPASEISAQFRANGTVQPPDPDYQALAKNNFVDWRLKVDGLVKKPLSLSLADIRAFPAQSQITRHNCVEGWSCIGKWSGARLSHVLDEAGLMDDARYVVFYCGDSMDPNSIVSTDSSDSNGDDDASDDDAKASGAKGASASADSDANSSNAADSSSDDDSSDDADDALPDTHYYSSIDLVDARHPQTIIAYEMNDKPLTVPYGAPARLRVERQLGYKMPKYLMRMTLVRDFGDIRGGKGGYWEDLGYDWFAGI